MARPHARSRSRSPSPSPRSWAVSRDASAAATDRTAHTGALGDELAAVETQLEVDKSAYYLGTAMLVRTPNPPIRIRSTETHLFAQNSSSSSSFGSSAASS